MLRLSMHFAQRYGSARGAGATTVANTAGGRGPSVAELYRLLLDKRTSVDTLSEDVMRRVSLPDLSAELQARGLAHEERQRVLLRVVKRLNDAESWAFFADCRRVNVSSDASPVAGNEATSFGRLCFDGLGAPTLPDLAAAFSGGAGAGRANPEVAARVLVEGAPAAMSLEAAEAELRRFGAEGSRYRVKFDFFQHFRTLDNLASIVREARGDAETVALLARLFKARVASSVPPKQKASAGYDVNTRKRDSRPSSSSAVATTAAEAHSYRMETAARLFPMTLAAAHGSAHTLCRAILDTDAPSEGAGWSAQYGRGACAKHGALLVKHGLTDVYAELLRSGAISALSSSFAPFLEELGSYPAARRPSLLLFTLPRVAIAARDGVAADSRSQPSEERALLALAPLSAYWRALLAGGRVRTRAIEAETLGAETAGGSPAEGGQQRLLLVAVDVTPPAAKPACGEEGEKGVVVLFEDDTVLVVNKPAGMPTVDHMMRAPQAPRADLVGWLLGRLPSLAEVKNCGLVQRLDAETSGVLVVAKTAEAHARLSPRDFSGKVYTAVCRDFRQRGEKGGGRSGGADISHGGEASLLTVVERVKPDTSGGSSRPIVSQSTHAAVRYYPCSIVAVKVEIQHGKKHQIRRHLASAGLPILNDPRYGVGATVAGSRRMMLHCRTVTFTHPTTQEEVTFSAPMPRDIVHFLKEVCR